MPAAVLGICSIVLAGVGLALKGDIAVGQFPTAILHEAHKPLYYIPKEEGQPQHFALLQHMDILMLQFNLAESALRKHHA